MIINKEFIDRFEKFVIPEPNTGCWLWVGLKKSIYGRFTVRNQYGKLIPEMAHAVSKFIYDGIPLGSNKRGSGFNFDHLCNTTICVNPKHIKLTSVRENTLRGSSPPATNAQKEHCPKGHLLAGDNLNKFSLRVGKRTCRICYNEQGQIRDKRRRRERKL